MYYRPKRIFYFDITLGTWVKNNTQIVSSGKIEHSGMEITLLNNFYNIQAKVNT